MRPLWVLTFGTRAFYVRSFTGSRSDIWKRFNLYFDVQNPYRNPDFLVRKLFFMREAFMSRTGKCSLAFPRLARFTSEPSQSYGLLRSPGSPVNTLIALFAWFARFTKVWWRRYQQTCFIHFIFRSILLKWTYTPIMLIIIKRIKHMF